MNVTSQEAQKGGYSDQHLSHQPNPRAAGLAKKGRGAMIIISLSIWSVLGLLVIADGDSQTRSRL
jgi:hypothetical protein